MRYFDLRSILLVFALFFSINTFANADEAAEKLEREADNATRLFYKEVRGGEEFLNKVNGYIVFPKILKGGLFVGGSYGKGVMRINGETRHYYDVTSASFGFQFGAQEHAMIIAFMTETSLNNFIRSNGWEAGVDGSIVVSEHGISKDITSLSYEKPIIAFIYGEKGLMGGISMEGSKFKRIVP